MKKQLLVFGIASSLGLTLIAQPPAPAGVDKTEQVTITLTSNGIATALYPFDVPFLMSGSIPDNCTQILFSYKVNSGEKRRGHFPSWISLPDRHPSDNFPADMVWNKSSGDQVFQFKCPGLHPNIHYDFRFQIIRNIASDDKVKLSLKQKLSQRIIQFTTSFAARKYMPADLTALNDDLTAIIKSALITNPATQSIKDKTNIGTDYTIDIKTKLNAEFGNLRTQNDNIIDAKDNLYNAAAGNRVARLMQVFTAVNAPSSTQLLAEVNLILSGNAPLNDFSKAFLDAPVTPQLESFKGYTVRTGLLILKKICLSPPILASILKGQSKISNNDIVAATTLDAESIYFLQALIAFLDDGNFKTTSGTTLFRQLNTSGVRANFDDAGLLIKTWMDAQVLLNKFVENFPDLTLGIVINESLTSQVISVTDVTSSSTPYISLDGGIGYTSTLQSAYSFYGASIYASPVNKKANFKDFKGFNKWKKKFCLNVGILSLFSDRPLHTYSILGNSSKNDLYVGLGYRLNRIFKVNANCLPYKVSTNPATLDKEVRIGFSAGICVDINLLGAFGTLAKTLNITP